MRIAMFARPLAQTPSNPFRSPLEQWLQMRLQDWAGDRLGLGLDPLAGVQFGQRDGMLEVTAHLPGIEPDAIAVDATPDSLTLSGRQQVERLAGGVRAVSFSQFQRVIPLPVPVRDDQTLWKMEGDRLVVSLPLADPDAASRDTARWADRWPENWRENWRDALPNAWTAAWTELRSDGFDGDRARAWASDRARGWTDAARQQAAPAADWWRDRRGRLEANLLRAKQWLGRKLRSLSDTLLSDR